MGTRSKERRACDPIELPSRTCLRLYRGRNHSPQGIIFPRPTRGAQSSIPKKGSANRDQTIGSGENRWDYTEQTNRWPNGAQNSDARAAASVQATTSFDSRICLNGLRICPPIFAARRIKHQRRTSQAAANRHGPTITLQSARRSGFGSNLSHV